MSVPDDEAVAGLRAQVLALRAERDAVLAEKAVLASQLAKRNDTYAERQVHLAATNEILAAMAASPADPQPVFDLIATRARDICGSYGVSVMEFDGVMVRLSAWTGVSDDPAVRQAYVAQFPRLPDPTRAEGRAILDRRVVHVRDYQSERELRLSTGNTTVRSNIAVPMRRGTEVIGVVTMGSREVGGFSDSQVELLKTFAEQAVIAITSAAAHREQREWLAQQTAMAEVLQVINASPGKLEPVFEAMLEKALRLCEADAGFFGIHGGDGYSLAALQGLSPGVAQAFADAYRAEQSSRPMHPDSGAGRIMRGESIVHILDIASDGTYRSGDPGRRILVDIGGGRTQLCAALRKDGELLGVILLWRREVRAFTDKQIALLESFAAQAVIAMENARLLDEVRQRQAELRVTFDNMGDGVAMFDADVRLAAWNRNFERIMGFDAMQLAERPTYATYLGMLAQRGEFGTDNVEAELASRLEHTDRELRLERTRPDGTVIEVRRNVVPGGGFVLIYSDITARKRAEAEIRAARDAAEAALERQTATADILKVIASSPTDVQPVLEALVKAAVRFCGATDATISLRDGDEIVRRAHEGPLDASVGARRPVDGDSASARAIRFGRTVHYQDINALDPAEFAGAHSRAARDGYRAALAAPMIRDGVAIGNIALRKVEAGAFTSQQIALIETFAAQAVIAIENVRLFNDLRDSLERLKAAQANLVQSEKMASLGQLTAGIAHEIKNPLNFVNNFAGLSGELLEELRQGIEALLAAPDDAKQAEIQDTMDLLTGNLARIVEHGRRADGIVKSMLAHSRGGTGDWQTSNINSLVEEALNLAYHGARAQDPDFNVTLERDLSEVLKPVDVVPQDITRVFLNLFGNGFYATRKRRYDDGDASYSPVLKVTTRELGDAVEILVRDNGTGINADVRAKLFQPFFTTKPTGEGTGLGLSISYDIVTQQHGGSIEVESEPGQYAEFRVRLPRARRAAASAGGG